MPNNRGQNKRECIDNNTRRIIGDHLLTQSAGTRKGERGKTDDSTELTATHETQIPRQNGLA